MTATHWSAIDSTRTGADNLGVRHTEANAYTRLARIYGSEGWGFESLRVRQCDVSGHR
jgi:hypothetical protein